MSSPFNGNLILKTAKPIGTMILLFSFLSFGLLYNETIQGNLSNEELAVEVFVGDTFEEYKTARDFENYKFLLADNGEFIELKNIKRCLNNRWYDEKFNASFQVENGDYSIMTLNEGNLISGVIFGKNKDATIIEINFKGTKYLENIIEDDYFIIPFPSFERIDKLTDFYNIFNGEKSTDLEIKFYDKDGNECPYIKFT